MQQGLGCLFVFLFIILWMVIGAVINIWNTVMRPFKPQNGKQNEGPRQRTTNSSRNGGNSRQRRRKLFEDNEGEYVDFVEV